MIETIDLYRLCVPLTVPYKVSKRTFRAFMPLVAMVRTRDGRNGWGEASISPGYGGETPDGGWTLLNAWSEKLVGQDLATAQDHLALEAMKNPHAASVLLSAIEMIEKPPLLTVQADAEVPLLVPVNTMDPDRVADEVEGYIADGFRTLKVKVGFDVDADLGRTAAIQRVVAGRATIRLDANQAFCAEQGRRFAAALEPTGIELFEQPCDKADWAANAAVAAVSTVPVMLDESIYSENDIERARTVPGVGLIKLKLKKLGSLTRLETALRRISAMGMQPVLGDGTATDISCWMEAGIARSTIRSAGENNGFLKLTQQLFVEPLPFGGGAIRLPKGWWPKVDEARVRQLATETRRYAARSVVSQAG